MEWFNLPRVGLLYDVVGAVILVYGHLTSGRTEFAEADLFWGSDVKIKGIITAKIDSIVGVSFLCLGFLWQLVGTDSALSHSFTSCFACVALVLGFMITVPLIYFPFRARVVRWYSRRGGG
jgi:hypothetical protein